MILSSPRELSGIVDVFIQAAPSQFFDQLQRDLGLSARQRVFTLPLVVWLMISQRLSPKSTLSSLVQGLVQGPPHQLLPNHKRVRERTLSCHTGACSDARQALPVIATEKVADHVTDHLMIKTCREALPGWSRRVFILDGSSLETPHTADLVDAYPPDSKSHWTVLRILVA